MRFATALCREQGGRKENEDSLLELRRAEKDAFVLVGADGLGGHGNGLLASQTAVKAIGEGFIQQPCLEAEYLTELFQRANQEILSMQSPTNQMRSTAAALFYHRGRLAAGYIGDTRIYRFRGGKILYQSKDHSVPQMEVDAGEITPEEIRFHPDRNRLFRALGEESCRPTITLLGRARPKDAFLICTDGFWEHVEEGVMLGELKSSKTPQEWLEGMKTKICGKASPSMDNYSAAALRVSWF